MSRIRLLRTTSFRLATIYLALFTASALALGAFVYLSIRHEILTDFDERIVEETDALRERLRAGRTRAAGANARGARRGRRRLLLRARKARTAGCSAGDLSAPAGEAPAAGWRRARPRTTSRPRRSRKSSGRSRRGCPTGRRSSSATSSAAPTRFCAACSPPSAGRWRRRSRLEPSAACGSARSFCAASIRCG